MTKARPLACRNAEAVVGGQQPMRKGKVVFNMVDAALKTSNSVCGGLGWLKGEPRVGRGEAELGDR